MTFRIGGAQGYYGDDVTRALPMIMGEHVDVVCFEALAELTLAILKKDQLRDPARGYTFDLELIAKKILPHAFERKIPLITNGGGLNPRGAAEMAQAVANDLGLEGLRIATVMGDNMLSSIPDLLAGGHTFEDHITGEPFDTSIKDWVQANVYLGALPIVEALQAGADLIITGRVADPCLHLAPLIHHYGWSWDDWNRLASGIVAGHLLECTAQVVGGNSLAMIDHVNPNDLPHLGYPIAHVEEDGSFILSGTPGMPSYITNDTVKEQLLYEIHDPSNYITPDVIVDMTTLRLKQVAENQVRVENVAGKPRPQKLKLNLGRIEGYRRELIATLGWPQTHQKFVQLQAMIESLWKDIPIERVEYRFLGENSLFQSLADLRDDPLELIVRINFTAADETILKTAVRRLMTTGLSGPAGMAIAGNTIGGKARPIIGLWSTLIQREFVEPSIEILEV